MGMLTTYQDNLDLRNLKFTKNLYGRVSKNMLEQHRKDLRKKSKTTYMPAVEMK